MTNVHSGPWGAKSIGSSSDGTSGRLLDNSGGPPDDPRMEERVKKLEDLAEKTGAELRTIDIRLAKIETKMDAFATKEDMAKLGVAMQSEINAQTWKLITWVCGFGTALVGITYFLATHVGK